jgi:hypothetical protein
MQPREEQMLQYMQEMREPPPSAQWTAAGNLKLEFPDRDGSLRSRRKSHGYNVARLGELLKAENQRRQTVMGQPAPVFAQVQWHAFSGGEVPVGTVLNVDRFTDRGFSGMEAWGQIVGGPRDGHIVQVPAGDLDIINPHEIMFDLEGREVRSWRGRRQIVWVDPRKLDADWEGDTGFWIAPLGKGAAIKGRYPDFLEWVTAGILVEPSRLSLRHSPSHLGRRGDFYTVIFGDGRHRFAAMRDMGVPAVPVLVPNDQVELFKQRYGVYPSVPPR